MSVRDLQHPQCDTFYSLVQTGNADGSCLKMLQSPTKYGKDIKKPLRVWLGCGGYTRAVRAPFGVAADDDVGIAETTRIKVFVF